jgi:hypothetical protein
MNIEQIKQKDAAYRLVVRLQERTLNIIMVYSSYLALREVEAKVGKEREINNLYNVMMNSFMRVIALYLWIILGEEKDTHYVKLLNSNNSLTSSMNSILGNTQPAVGNAKLKIKAMLLKELLCKISGVKSTEFDKDLSILKQYRNNHGAHYGNHDGTDKTPNFINLTRFAFGLYFFVHYGIKHRKRTNISSVEFFVDRNFIDLIQSDDFDINKFMDDIINPLKKEFKHSMRDLSSILININ